MKIISLTYSKNKDIQRRYRVQGSGNRVEKQFTVAGRHSTVRARTVADALSFRSCGVTEKLVCGGNHRGLPLRFNVFLRVLFVLFSSCASWLQK